ncbi:uncharacterized protein BJ212DRAFT_1308037 [Suillus subaureus]|uniref:Uncharacterized protein n=1 Tax=Suillus subaureus TaxID=48587 RepID=A0A9P7JJT3_9AGAM|nr:uncharacterized protein BJ212DRAFT_1308037 [Suillus subaureus]KAG1826753.1 hypothetical protein BJ212DRAFT_1308037 [Suillus subaureus]
MVSEDNPLLTSTVHEAMIAMTVFVSSIFAPSISKIAKDLGSIHAVVSLTVSLSILASAAGALVWAAYSSLCTRIHSVS